jgi:hypothetical protein
MGVTQVRNLDSPVVGDFRRASVDDAVRLTFLASIIDFKIEAFPRSRRKSTASSVNTGLTFAAVGDGFELTGNSACTSGSKDAVGEHHLTSLYTGRSKLGGYRCLGLL